MIYRNTIKRLLDITCALAAMIVFCWLYVIVAILVRINLGSPIIFKQERPGMKDKKTGKERIFFLYKFRSMTDEKDSKGNLLSDDVRLTKFGRFLRSTSLDELPEAFNILKGDMSVIGPRPWLVEYLPYYTEEEHHRHDVRPGLSGLAQINGRNANTWKERFDWDLYYVKNCSFSMDVSIVFKTIGKFLKRSDVQVGSEIKAGRLDIARRGRIPEVRIRKFEETDIPLKVEWINNPNNNKYLGYDLPLTIEKTHRWFENNKTRSDRVDFTILADGIPVGTNGFIGIDNDAEYYITIGEEIYKGKGVATEATRLALKYAFEELKLPKVHLTTDKNNIAAKSLYEKIGFICTDEKEGRLYYDYANPAIGE